MFRVGDDEDCEAAAGESLWLEKNKEKTALPGSKVVHKERGPNTALRLCWPAQGLRDGWGAGNSASIHFPSAFHRLQAS